MKPKSKTKENFLRTETIANLQRLNQQTPTAISLFTGAGGMDLGVREAGFDIRVMIEKDHYACETLRANWTKEGLKECHRSRRPSWYQFPEPVIMETDITKLSIDTILDAAQLKAGEPSLVMGGFPCQGFSASNSKRHQNLYLDKRNKLYLECVRIVKGTLPRYFIFENVPGLIHMAKGEIINGICQDFAKIGYEVMWDRLNAADYGVPQNRVRVFFIGQRNDLLWTDGKRMRLHLAAHGSVRHPAFFLKQYPRFKQGETCQSGS